MNNLYTALSLSFVADKRFCIITDDFEKLHNGLVKLLTRACQIDQNEIRTIDVQQCSIENDENGLLESITAHKEEDGSARLCKIIIWRKLEETSREYQSRRVSHFLNELDAYNTYRTRYDKERCVHMMGRRINKPKLFIIIPIVVAQPAHPNVHQQLKQKFWFAEAISSKIELGEVDSLSIKGSYEDFILNLRNNVISEVFVSSEIDQYIYSLVVHARNHRLCSLAPIHARLSTQSYEYIRLLAIHLVAWRHQMHGSLYVTPSVCKTAMRKVSYWFIDWEFDCNFAHTQHDDDSTATKRLEIWMLTGDWYGSSWKYVKKYLHESLSDNSTHFYNRIVEDSIESVKPPM